MIGQGFLPLIVHPTRVTDTSSTVIDNIYSNCFDYNQNSGDILITISEHFSQFTYRFQELQYFSKRLFYL